MTLKQHREEVAYAVRSLDQKLQHLVNLLVHEPVWAEVENTGTKGSAIAKACEALAAVDYQMDDTPNQSIVCLGVLGVSADVLKGVHAVNSAKSALKQACVPLQGLRIRVPVKGASGPTRAIQAVRVLLRSIQRSDLNLLAAYRKIPILDALPKTVNYTVARTRAVYRKSIEEIQLMLQTREGSTATEDRAILETLDRSETHLALVRDRYLNIRANVVYAKLDPRGRGRAQFAAELPLMFVLRPNASPPTVSFPILDMLSNEPSRARQQMIQERPFLGSIPVYRYLPN